MTKEELQLVIRAIDEASANLKAIRGEVHQVGETSQNATKQVESLGQKLTSLGGQLKLGFAVGLGQDILGGLTSGLEKIVSLIPQAVSTGDAWATQIAQIRRETGMTAEQASLLVSVMERADVPTENMGRLFAMLGRNLATNEGLFKRLGVATRDANGDLLDGYSIVDNLRRRFSEYGSSLVETAAAQKLFGRTGYEMLQFLQLNDQQFHLFAQAAQAAGEVLNEDVIAGAERFNRTWQDLFGTLKGLQTGIFAGLEPTLEAFVASFAEFVRAHMAQIIAFVVNAANFVLGVIGGLLGIDFGQITLARQVEDAAGKTEKLAGSQEHLQRALAGSAAGEDQLTKALRRQIEAIDAQIRAIDEREAKRRAGSERTRLQTAVEQAQSQLADLQGSAPYTEGMSAAEAELAVQKHNQDILDAQKALNDAIAALREFDANAADDAEKRQLENKKASLQKQLEAHRGAHAGMAAHVAGLVSASSAGATAIGKSMSTAFATMTADAKDWRDKGVAFAGDLKRAIGGLLDAILGTETTMSGDIGSRTNTSSSRTGGLMGAFAAIGRAFAWLAGVLSGMADFIKSLFTPKPGVRNPHWPAAPSDGGFQMGGYVPPGGAGRVGEVAAEVIYARPGGGVDIYGRMGGAVAGGDHDHGHGHPIYINGRLLMQLLDAEFAPRGRMAPGSIRPTG